MDSFQTERIRAFFDSKADQWDTLCRHDLCKVEALVTLCDVQPGHKVIDIACGTGVMLPFLLARRPADLLGIDLSPRMIEAAKAKFGPSPALRLKAADLFELEETGFHRAMLYSAYPHFPDRRRLAEKLHALLAPGGRFLICHSEGKSAINSCHTKKEVHPISTPLGPAIEESGYFNGLFKIDALADTDGIYFFSGVKI